MNEQQAGLHTYDNLSTYSCSVSKHTGLLAYSINKAKHNTVISSFYLQLSENIPIISNIVMSYTYHVTYPLSQYEAQKTIML